MCGCKAMARDRVWERDVPCSVKFGLSHYSLCPDWLCVEIGMMAPGTDIYSCH